MRDASQVISSEVAKAAPPVTVLTTSLVGVGWQTVVWVLTAAYLVAQIGYLLWRWRRDWRRNSRETQR